MNLKEAIVKNKPREIAGATSASRFDYQKDWSICTLLENHSKSSDYLFLFDYHEDLILMDSESNPQKISFYQLKGRKSGNWTIDRLIKSEKGKDGNSLLSIIGKLYDCKSKFDLQTESLNLVSNASFNLHLASGEKALSKSSICIVEITDEDKTKIKQKLIKELSLTAEPQFEDITFLKVTELSLSDSANHTKGKLSDFLELIIPNGKFAIPALYKSLFEEVKRRTNYNKEIHSFEDLIIKKGICKRIFNEWLGNVGAFKNYDEIWTRITNALTNEGVGVLEIKTLKRAWTDFEIETKNPNNEVFLRIRDKVKQLLNELEKTGVLNDLRNYACMNKILEYYKQSETEKSVYDESIIKATILAEIYE